MAQNKEQLNKLLQFIEKLVNEPGNEDFVVGLRRIIGSDTSIISGGSSQLANIEKYLGLDFVLDTACPVIDYSFIHDDYVRERLNSDNREMLRYRYGLRSHKIDFKEVCRYAIMQEELLLNYFYISHFKSFDEMKASIIEQVTSSYDKRIEKRGDSNKKIEMEKKREIDKLTYYTTYDQIPLSTKQKAFANLYGEEHILENARRVRNELSHRSAQEESDDIKEDKAYLEKIGVKISDTGFINNSQFENNPDLRSKVFSDKRYWTFTYKVWKTKKPSDEVITALRDFTEIIKKNI